jgi:hypothetical protein
MAGAQKATNFNFRQRATKPGADTPEAGLGSHRFEEQPDNTDSLGTGH